MLRLKFHRIKKDLSQGDLAALTNITRAEICRIETGRSNATQKELLALSKVLGVPADSLMDHVVDPLDGSDFRDSQRKER